MGYFERRIDKRKTNWGFRISHSVSRSGISELKVMTRWKSSGIVLKGVKYWNGGRVVKGIVGGPIRKRVRSTSLYREDRHEEDHGED